MEYQTSKKGDFRELVGMLSNPDYQRVLDNLQGELLDFDRVHHVVHAASLELSGKLYDRYGSRNFHDYGDESLISAFFDTAFDELYKEVLGKCTLFSQRYRALFDKVCDFTELAESGRLSPDDQADSLAKLIVETEDLLVYCKMNGEILEAIERLHFKKFYRPFMVLFWKKYGEHDTGVEASRFGRQAGGEHIMSKEQERFKDFFLHGVVIGLARHLSYMVEQLQKTQGWVLKERHPNMPLLATPEKYINPMIPGLVKTESNRAVTQDLPAAPLPSLPLDATLDQKLTRLDYMVQEMANLIGSYKLFLDSFVKQLSIRYSMNAFWRGKYQEYMRSPHTNRAGYYTNLYEMPIVFHDGALEEREYENGLDLILILSYLFFTTACLAGLSISSYLYTTTFNISAPISGALQAIEPFGALFFLMIWVKFAYFRTTKVPYIIWTLFFMVGNILYYFAASSHDYINTKGANAGGIILISFGQICFGIGCARLEMRGYLANTIKPWAQTKYSSIYVAVFYLGWCFGGGLQAWIYYAEFDKYACRDMAGTKMCHHNMLAFIFIFVMIVFLALYLLFFSGFDVVKAQAEKSREFKIVQVFRALNKLNLDNAVEILKEEKMRGRGSELRGSEEAEIVAIANQRTDRKVFDERHKADMIARDDGHLAHHGAPEMNDQVIDVRKIDEKVAKEREKQERAADAEKAEAMAAGGIVIGEPQQTVGERLPERHLEAIGYQAIRPSPSMATGPLQHLNTQVALVQGSNWLLQEKTKDPFIGEAEAVKLKDLKKTEKAARALQKSESIDFQAEIRSQNPTLPVSDHDWRADIKYLVYHPKGYFFLCVLILFVDRVS